MRSVTGLLLLGLAVMAQAQDFDAIRRAAEQGDANAQFDMGMLRAREGHYSEAIDWYRKSAEQANARAQYNLGIYTRDGQGTPQDYKQAADWLRKSAEQGNVDAQYALGLLYMEVESVRDNRQAAQWFRKAAEREPGNGVAVSRVAGAALGLGYLYRAGHGVPQDLTQAAVWFRKAAELGLAQAQYNLADMYHTGEGVPQDFQAAAQWYRQAAGQGNVDAMFNLGDLYYRGQGIGQDDGQAANWFGAAAKKGDARAQRMLGFLYSKGRGVEQDNVLACMFYNLAAAGGDDSAQPGLSDVATVLSPTQIAVAQVLAHHWRTGNSLPSVHFAGEEDNSAQALLGKLLYEGIDGVTQDVPEAMRWLRMAAEQGNANAQYLMGDAYQGFKAAYGGPERDDAQAALWYRRAAEQGIAAAQYSLGDHYRNGWGVAQDNKQAAVWYRKAAEQDNTLAQYELSELYLFGAGVPADCVLAYMLLNMVSVHGQGWTERTLLEKSLSSRQIREAETLQQQWKPGTPLPTASKTGGKMPLALRMRLKLMGL
jgi:TPR repeat protein